MKRSLRGRRKTLLLSGVAQWNKDSGHRWDTDHEGEDVTQESARDRAAFRDMPASGASGLHQTAQPGTVRTRVYVIAVLIAGCFVLAHSVMTLRATELPMQWWALVALTLISGSAVLKIPSVSVNFSISDVFTLTTAVVFGPAAGTVIVAIDSLVISGCLRRVGLPLERFLFNAAAPPVAMWLSAIAFFRTSGLEPLYTHPLGLEVVGPWLLVFAALYFVLNTFAIAVAVSLHERVNVVSIWRKHFQGLWITFIGGGLSAAFVVFALQLGTYGMVILALPLILAVILHFAYRNATGRVADQLDHLAEVNRLHLSTIEALARAVDAKDGVTHGHIRRVQSTALALAKRLGVNEQPQLRAIEAAALLHDVGKLAIPEHILNKPGRLTSVEFERMKSHARIGAEILSEVGFPYPVVPIVRHHHENWDGTGYPEGLKSDEIPIGARILAVVDCFDALTSNRPYRRALSLSEALQIVDSRRGTMYDPAVVDVFADMCHAGEVTAADPMLEDAAPTHLAVNVSDAAAKPASAEAFDDIQVALALGASLSAGSGGQGTWPTIADALCQLPCVDTAAVFVLDETEQWLVAHHVRGSSAQHIERLAIAVGERMSGWVAASGQAMVNGDAALDLFDVHAGSLRSALGVPCTGPDGHRAVVALYSTRPGAFSLSHQRLVEAVVSRASHQHDTAQVVDIRQSQHRMRRPRSLIA
jgi:putative nucleotidyltransferase with HDIG domain